MVREPGQPVAGRYHLVEVIGRGGMGAVWRARDETLGRDVAVKELVLPPVVGKAERDAFCARTIREARSAAGLKHPGIVTIHDVIQQNGLPWIIMELVAGRSLADVIDSGGPLPPATVARIGLRILDALRAAHAAGIVHRDVKPANVLLEGGSPGTERVVLTDFGIAAVEGDAAITQSGLILGTPAFMAPEQARGLRATERSDLWSLGATLYAAAEGGPPYRGPSSGAVFMALATEEPRPPVHAGPLTPVLRGLLRKDPEHRLSADQTARLLRHVADGVRPHPRGRANISGAEPATYVESPPPQAEPSPQAGAAFQPGASPHAAGTPPQAGGSPQAGTHPRGEAPPLFSQSPQELFEAFRSTLTGPPGSPTWAQIPGLWWAEVWRRPWTPIWRFPPEERLRRAAVFSPLTLLYPPFGFVFGLIIVIMMHRRGDHGWQYKVALVPVLLGGLVVALLVIGSLAAAVSPPG
ncbi:MAG TPA: serine/threonine-protein kinase [Streptosporangiaceae bacterium]|nr:serine/threonine-protein kinase [Streptosporangiaceae bacterium]